MLMHVFSRDDKGKVIASHELLLDDIYYWTVEKTSTIVFTTKKGVFFKTAKFEELALLCKDQLEVVRTERVIMVNASNVVKYDSESGKVYFGEDLANCLWTYIATSRLMKLKSIVGVEKDIADRKSAIYAPASKKRLLNNLFSLMS